MKEQLVASILVLSLSSGLAYAQTDTTNEKKPAAGATTEALTTSVPPAESTPANAAADTHGGLSTAESATIAVRFVSVQPADLMSSNVVGTDIYNKDNDKVGEISDLVIHDGRTLAGVVASVGGFLGLGEHYVVLDPATVVVAKKDDEWGAYVNTTKDDLKNAPEFKYSDEQR